MIAQRQITGALAWAGLVIVIAVPATEAIISRVGPKTVAVVEPSPMTQQTVAPATPATPVAVPSQPVPPAAKVAPTTATVTVTKTGAVVTPAAPVVTAKPAPAPVPTASAPAEVAPTTGEQVPADPVGDYLATNKTLPSYIRPNTVGTADAKRPTPVLPSAQLEVATTNTAPPTTATTPAAKPVVSSPVQSASVKPMTSAAAAPLPTATASVAPPKPKPAIVRPKPQTVTEADLKDWKTGTLEEYLRGRGLLTQSGGASASGD